MLTRGPTTRSLSDYLTVSQAATFLGVSASTLRNWDRLGKVAARRHPVNGYRLYLQTDLVRMLKQTERVAERSHRLMTKGAGTMRGRRYAHGTP